jgi:UDP:flavonoid glycosyltransferase YjiC (YdhE family)
MRIVIIAPGSRGDLEPYLALGKGLIQAGHAVRLVTHQDFEALVNSHGVEFWPVDIKVQDIVQSAELRALLQGGNFAAILAQMAKEAKEGALRMVAVGLAACRGTDLVLAGIGGLFPAIALAEKLGLPLLQAYYIPFTPTQAYPSFLFPKPPFWHNGSINRLTYWIARQMMWQAYRPADRLARQKALDLPPAPFWGPFNAGCTRHMPVLYGYSPSVIPPPPDWGDTIHVTGYWFLDPADDWAPPQALVEFLQAGPPPVYIGFGSMSSRRPEETTAMVLQALAQAQQRAVILSGWGGMHQADLPPSIFMIDSAPFSWLFPRMAAVVHHGGAGTTAAGLRAGVPSVVVPFFGDQPYWGQRIVDLGVGPAPISRRKLTAARLAQAIETAVTDLAMGQRAAELGAIIRAEDGVGRAIEVIQQIEAGKSG